MSDFSNLWKKSAHFVILILMGLQICLGVIYAISNFTVVQSFAETSELLEVSKTLVLDEYLGILYPLLLAFCQVLAELTTIPFCAFIYLVQVFVSFTAGYFVVGIFQRNCWKRIYATLFLVTVPMLMQFHMAVLPFSLSLSCFEVFFGILLLIWRRNTLDTKMWILLGIVYACSSLLVVDTFWILGLLLTVTLIKRLVDTLRQSHLIQKKMLIKTCIAMLLTICVVSGVKSLTIQPGSHGKIQNSFGAAMVSRFVWPNFATNYFFWSDEVKAIMTEEDAIKICQREDEVYTLFGPLIENAVGKKEANRIYLEMAKRCLLDRTREIALEILDDFADYGLIPWNVWGNLEGHGTSLTGWNYGKMTAHSPGLVKLYFAYGLWEITLLVLLTAVGKVRTVISHRKPVGIKSQISLVLVSGFVFALWNTMRSNMPVDYKLVLPVIFLWYFIGIGQELEEEN